MLYGDVAELKALSRCEACQNRDSPCFIQVKGDRCIACLGATCDCVFVRRASKNSFSWDQLIGKTNPIDLPTDEAVPTSR